MKKIFGLILIAVMMVTMHVAAIGEETHEHAEGVESFSVDGFGIEMHIDPSWSELAMSGAVLVSTNKSADDPVGYTTYEFGYTSSALPETWNAYFPLFAFVNRLENNEYVPENFVLGEAKELGRADGRVYEMYISPVPTADTGIVLEDITSIEKILTRMSENTQTDVYFSAPTPGVDDHNHSLDSFSAMNLSSGEAIGPELFEKSGVTMVNIWATFCSPCVSEMPELKKISDEYADKGMQVVGLLVDAGTTEDIDDETLEYAKLIVEKTGADYMHIVADHALFHTLNEYMQSVPTTLFFNEKGELISEPYVGARDYDGWKQIVDGVLSSQN